MKIKQIADFLWAKYPNENQEEWDKSGFNIEFNFNKKFSGAIVAIDLTTEVLERAIETKSNLIITHHPFIFENELSEELEKYQYKNDIYKLLKNNEIFVLSLHTNYDIDKFGTSYQIVKALELENAKFQNDGYPCLVDYKTTPSKLLKTIKEKLLLFNFRTNLSKDQFESQINKIAFFSGSGDSGDILKKSKQGYELIITSDVKWSDWIAYNQSKVAVIEIPHLDEQVFVNDIFIQLIEEFKNYNFYSVFLKEQCKNL